MIKKVLEHVKYGKPWICEENVSSSSVYSFYRKLLKLKVLKEAYIRDYKYKEETTPKQTKNAYFITDTTFVRNKYGSEKVKYNGQKKGKGTKISLISNENKNVAGYTIEMGSAHDSKILFNQLDRKLIIEPNFTNNPIYFLADSGYDAEELINKIKDKGYYPIIAENKRRNENNKRFMTDEEHLIYKNRTSIEHINKTIKDHRRLNCRYDRNIEQFEGSLLFALIDNINNQ